MPATPVSCAMAASSTSQTTTRAPAAAAAQRERAADAVGAAGDDDHVSIGLEARSHRSVRYSAFGSTAMALISMR